MTGYISDEACAVKSAKSAKAADWIIPDAFEACAKRCLKEGSTASTPGSQQQFPEPATRGAGLRMAIRYDVTSRFRGRSSAGQARFSEILDHRRARPRFFAFHVDMRGSRVSFLRYRFSRRWVRDSGSRREALHES
jgi:hypothetical protein